MFPLLLALMGWGTASAMWRSTRPSIPQYTSPSRYHCVLTVHLSFQVSLCTYCTPLLLYILYSSPSRKTNKGRLYLIHQKLVKSKMWGGDEPSPHSLSLLMLSYLPPRPPEKRGGEAGSSASAQTEEGGRGNPTPYHKKLMM